MTLVPASVMTLQRNPFSDEMSRKADDGCYTDCDIDARIIRRYIEVLSNGRHHCNVYIYLYPSERYLWEVLFDKKFKSF